MSYVAERIGGGLHDLLRGFDSFRNYNKKAPSQGLFLFYIKTISSLAYWNSL